MSNISVRDRKYLYWQMFEGYAINTTETDDDLMQMVALVSRNLASTDVTEKVFSFTNHVY